MEILNYKEAVNPIDDDDDVDDDYVSFCLNTNQWDGTSFSICDAHHKHISIGDLQIIKNKLRKLLAKGSNYGAPWIIKFFKALIETSTTLHTCIQAMTIKTKCTTSSFKSIFFSKRKKWQLKKENLNKQNQYWVTQMFESTSKNLIENLLFSPLIKHQAILHLYVQNTTFPNY